MKRQICFIIFIAVLFSSIHIAPAITSEAETPAVVDKKEIYAKVAEHLLNREKSFSVSCSYTAAVRSLIERIGGESESGFYHALYDITHAADQPGTTDDGDYLYGILWGANCYYSDGMLRFYGVKYFETKKQTKKVNQYTKKTARKLMKKTRNQYERLKLAYSFVIKRVTYDTRKKCFYSAYAGYVKRKTVCNGYALMLYKLLRKMGFSARFVSGKVFDGKKWYLHAWNKVKYHGKWYNLDACSDDEDDGLVYGDFFMVRNKKFSKTHRADAFY